jgi:hypothetical protein
MTTTIDFKDWLNEEYYRIATEYRAALALEVWYTKRIYSVIDGDVKQMLAKSLRSIPVPVLRKWDGERDGTMAIFNVTKKPDFEAILKEAIESI